MKFINLNFILVFNKIAFEIKRLNILLLVFSLFILIFLIIILISSFMFHRKKLINVKYKFYKNFLLEFILILIPLIFIILMFFISTNIILNIKKNKVSFLTLKLISYQWKWYYNYIKGLGKNINYFSFIKINIKEIINFKKKNKNYIQKVDNNLILPVKEYIRFILTSNDVIHSFYVPSLIIKQDCIPNLFKDVYFKSNKVGKYKGFCTELCGKNHSYMPIVIKFLSLSNYKKWILSKYFEKNLKINF